jgi:tetratricopeptide (TPR) repeat protein
VQRDLGDREAAERELRQALVVAPCDAAARVVFADMLREWKRTADQVALLEEGIDQCADDLFFRNDLAYLLATAGDDAVRDGARALEIARNVVAEAETERPDFLDTLACAWAEVGNYRRAVELSRRAVELIESRDVDEEVLSEYRSHLRSFEDARPIRVGTS